MQPGTPGNRGVFLRERDLAMTYQHGEQRDPYDLALLPPSHSRRASARQVIGSPYVWDGDGQSEDESARAQPGPAPWAQIRPVGRAVIGDEMRVVAAWCELGDCIGRYAESGALGQADIVARAMAAGWCKDGFGRLVCPSCQQRFPIWSSAPLVPRALVVTRQLGPPERYIGDHRQRPATSGAGRMGGGLRATAPGGLADRP